MTNRVITNLFTGESQYYLFFSKYCLTLSSEHLLLHRCGNALSPAGKFSTDFQTQCLLDFNLSQAPSNCTCQLLSLFPFRSVLISCIPSMFTNSLSSQTLEKDHRQTPKDVTYTLCQSHKTYLFSFVLESCCSSSPHYGPFKIQ